MEKYISPCGANCAECEKYPLECKGCFEIKGKVWWTSYTGKSVCDFYDCCKNQKNLKHCGKCANFPCSFFQHGDPTKTKEENEAILKMQIEILTKK